MRSREEWLEQQIMEEEEEEWVAVVGWEVEWAEEP